MTTREEYYTKLCDLIGKVTGSGKLKASNVYLTCLRGDLNKNFGHPQIKVCLEDIQALIADGAYTYQDKHGKTWIPIRLQVWAGTKKDEATTPIEAPAQVPAGSFNDEIGF